MLARRGLVLGACLSLFVLSPAAAQTVPAPTAVSGELFYTTFLPPAVKKVAFTYDSSGFQIGKRVLIANLPGADGIVFAPSGKLIVGGGPTGMIFQVDPDSGAVQILLNRDKRLIGIIAMGDIAQTTDADTSATALTGVSQAGGQHNQASA